MEIRKLCPEEWGAAAALVWQVFQRFEAPEYPPQGVEAFRSFLEDRQGFLDTAEEQQQDGIRFTPMEYTR